LSDDHRASARLWVVAALGVAALVIILLTRALQGTSTELRPGEPAPDFSFTTFAGEEMSLSDFRGRVVILNFWASWCVECALEAPALERTWREYSERGVVVLGLAYTDTEPAARAYLERFSITYPNGPDLGGRISRLYRLTGVPETVVVDPGGRLVPLGSSGAAPVVKLVGGLDGPGSLGEAGLKALLERLLDA
jgi:cytochrome c biogenesis protein CcmG/thiol:disulfide interchange protein DsbE